MDPILSDLILSLTDNSSDFNASTTEIPSFSESLLTLSPVINNILPLPDETIQITEPIIITKSPIFQISLPILNLWKKLIYDVKLSSKYNNSIVPTESYSMVISLLSWSELNIYGLDQYPSNIQKSGLIFLHFPIRKNNNCPHGYIERSKCKNKPCGYFVPYHDMDAITEMINEYMDFGNNVLIHSHNDQSRFLLFAACCMLHGGRELNEILEIMDMFPIQATYYAYIKSYGEYLQNIN